MSAATTAAPEAETGRLRASSTASSTTRRLRRARPGQEQGGSPGSAGDYGDKITRQPDYSRKQTMFDLVPIEDMTSGVASNTLPVMYTVVQCS